METSSGPPRVLCLSDVAPGYGSPQVQHFAASIASMLSDAEVLFLCPDQKGRVRQDAIYKDFEVRRVTTFLPPYDSGFAIEFNQVIAKVIREWKPSVVIASHGWVLPGVLRCANQPFSLIYYMLESLAHQVEGIGAWAMDINVDAFERADVVVTPERRRLAHDIQMLEVMPAREVEMYNTSLKVDTSALPAQERKRAILVAGSIGPDALTEMLLAIPESVPVSVAGPSDTVKAQKSLGQLRNATNITYFGMLPVDKVRDLRAKYAYSLVMWAPTDINRIYAAPNKFFESVAAGTPSICAPHPQCREIIRKYDCGILMRDWSEEALAEAVEEAMMIFDENPNRYDELVRNCGIAFREELNWESQFEKFRRVWP